MFHIIFLLIEAAPFGVSFSRFGVESGLNTGFLGNLKKIGKVCYVLTFVRFSHKIEVQRDATDRRLAH